MNSEKNKYLVYTVIFDGYDDLLEIDIDFLSDNIDFICITDDAELCSESWDVKYVERPKGLDGTLSNRKYKMMPHLFFDYEKSLYIDGNIKIVNNLEVLFEKYLSNNVLAIPFHPERNCLYDEADTCVKVGKSNVGDTEKLISKLINDGFPKNNGLYENNVIFRIHCNKVNTLMEVWYDFFCNNNIKRDQLSLSYLIWKHNVDCLGICDGPRNSHKYFKLCLHNLEKKKSYIKKYRLIIRIRKDVNFFYKVSDSFFNFFRV